MIFIFSFSIFFVCLAVILLIICAIPLWDSTTAQSPSGKELNPSSQEDTRFLGRCTSLAYHFHFILRHPSLGLSTAHSQFGEELNSSSQKDNRFSGRYSLAYKFYFILRRPSLGHSDSSLTLH